MARTKQTARKVTQQNKSYGEKAAKRLPRKSRPSTGKVAELLKAKRKAKRGTVALRWGRCCRSPAEQRQPAWTWTCGQ